jgi:hypothetical protein
MGLYEYIGIAGRRLTKNALCCEFKSQSGVPINGAAERSFSQRIVGNTYIKQRISGIEQGKLHDNRDPGCKLCRFAGSNRHEMEKVTNVTKYRFCENWNIYAK